MNDPQFVLFETESSALVDVEIFGHCGYGYQVQAEAVCERGTVRIDDEHGPRLSADGRWGGRVTPDYLERFADACDREVQAWVDAARRGETTGPRYGTAMRPRPCARRACCPSGRGGASRSR